MRNALKALYVAAGAAMALAMTFYISGCEDGIGYLTHLIAALLGFASGWCAVLVATADSELCDDCPKLKHK